MRLFSLLSQTVNLLNTSQNYLNGRILKCSTVAMNKMSTITKGGGGGESNNVNNSDNLYKLVPKLNENEMTSCEYIKVRQIINFYFYIYLYFNFINNN